MDEEIERRIDVLDAFKTLRDPTAGLYNVGEVRTFEAYRNAPDGSTQAVRIEVLDRGPGSAHRYHVEAKVMETGRGATGNPDASLEMALMNVHWDDLDRDR
jgi:hypothetical protein